MDIWKEIKNMKTTNETFRTILAKAAAVAVIMIMALAVLPQQVFAAPGTTVYVSNSAELKNALANTGADTIIFKNDITAEAAMTIAPKRTNTDLVIDGNGYTFTERKTSTRDSDAGIYLTAVTTIDTITIQNMNILGRNGYGTIYTNKQINQVFKNVTYTGPQMVNNVSGSVRIEDSTINIGQYNGNTYNGEAAEVNQVILAGDVSITKTGNSSDTIFKLKNSGAGITVKDGANVTVSNDKNTNNCSGLIDACASYNFNIGNNAVFSYAGKYYFDESCKLNNFAMGTDSEFNVRLNNNLTSKLIYASNAVTVGDGSAVNISIAGNSAGYVMYACKDITLGANSNVDIQTGDVTSGYIMKSYSGDINVGENASVNIKTGAVTCGDVVKARCGNITIGKNADFVVNSYGVMKNNLMWVKRDLTVKEGAVLDLIANKNSYTCCSYVLYVDGCCTAPSTITYENPERVLFYNDNTSSKACGTYHFAAYLGNYTSINFTVYSTEYWKSSKTTGGVAVLENADYRWYQDPVNDKSYNVKAVSKACAKGFNASFTSTGYVGDQKYADSRAMNALEYYFGKTSCKSVNYEVCLWNGKPAAAEEKTEYTVRYVDEDTGADLLTPYAGSGIVGETVTADAETIADYILTSDSSQSIILKADTQENIIIFYYKKSVNLAYVFNNEVHSNYTGAYYDLNAFENYTCVTGSAETVKELDDVFPDYIGTDEACEFMGWNTAVDGSGMYYYSGSSVTVNGDTTLYAIWKSCKPVVDRILEYVPSITGTGVLYGIGAAGSLINVILPDGVMMDAIVAADGTWEINVSYTSLPYMEAGEQVTVTQTEDGKLTSDPVIAIIQAFR